MNNLILQQRQLGGLWGAVVGDALGVPVEFVSRSELKQNPVTNMRGYGTYSQPAGTWSDDSSLMLCTLESLGAGFDTSHMGNLFVRWLQEAYWTPWNEVFDVGGTTYQALLTLSQGGDPEQAGRTEETSNGNGSLMRILPIGLRYFREPAHGLVEYAHRTSSLTHRHLRCQIACGFYCILIAALLQGADPKSAYLSAIHAATELYQNPPFASEQKDFQRVLSGGLPDLPEEEIRSDGYVVHTLEASIWCLLNTDSFSEAVLRAVNLGEDTDTTATVTGGLAGVYYGDSGIPPRWIEQLARREDLEGLFQQFVS